MNSAENLLSMARTSTGIALIDTEALEPLSIFIDSANKEGGLSEQGARDLEKFIDRSLCNRLRMQRDFKAHPEIENEVIKSPVFICGTTRTGSTKTHKLLAATGDFNYLNFWQSLNPALISGVRNESPDQRIKDTDEAEAWYDEVAPKMKLTHALHTLEAEEESFTLAHSLRTPVITGMVNVASYIKWLMTQDPSYQFIFLRDVLKYLQWQGHADPNKRWVLKSPFYSGLEPVLRSVFPDAQLLMTHRHPKETIPSTCSLFTSYRQPYSNARIDSLGVVDDIAMQMKMHLEVRREHPEIKFFDIHYLKIIKAAKQTIEQIYKFVDMPFTEKTQSNIKLWEEKNPIHKKGKHKYSLEEFDLTNDIIAQEFSSYIDFFNKLAAPEPSD